MNPNISGANKALGANIVNTGSNNFVGSLDNIGIWNRALTQQEITNLYNASTTTNTCPTLPSNLQTGLVGYWPFCGNANDESGNNRSGVVIGGNFISDRNGVSNSAVELSNLNNLIDITSALPPCNGNQQTISFWCKLPVQYNHSSLYWINSGSIYSNGFFVAIDQNDGAYGPNNYKIVYNIGLSQTASFISNQAEFGIWKNIVAVYDGAMMKLYVDGIQRASQSYTSGINSPNGNLQFADWNNPTTPNTNGRQIDDIAIWNRALTTAEVSQLYAAQSVNPNNGGGGSNSVVTNFPTGISYQAVARDSVGKPLANAAMTVRFTLRDSSVSGTAVYAETHAITTNALGLFTAVIGNGTPTTATYSTINWMGPQKFLSVEINTGSGFQLIGNQQMLSVPYSILSSKSIESTKIKNSSLPVFIDNAAAITGGLQAGDMYRTAAGVLMIVY